MDRRAPLTLPRPNSPTLRLPRVENWPAILRTLVAEHVAAPFAWGTSDCAFWADVIKAMTGWDALADCRGYHDALSARRALKNAGFHSVTELIEERLIEIPVAHAMRGDLVLFSGALDPLSSPAVLTGTHAFTKALSGPVRLSLGDCCRAFTV